jgi:uncharacterized membrane protein YheB (UPF0754 family)
MFLGERNDFLNNIQPLSSRNIFFFFNESMTFLFISLSAAIFGWLIIRLVLYILFHPEKNSNILGIKVQGVFPRKQNAIAKRLAHLVAHELFDLDEVIEKVKDPRHLEELHPFIESHVHEFLAVKLNEKIPVVSMFIGESTLNKLKEGLMEEIILLLPQVINKFTDKLSSQVDIEQIIAEKLAGFPSSKLETILKTNLRKEIVLLQLLGFAAGLLFGLIQSTVMVIL